MKKILVLLVPIVDIWLFNPAYAWQAAPSYYPRVNPSVYQYSYPSRYYPYQGYRLRHSKPYANTQRFSINNRFMPMGIPSMSPMGFGSPFPSTGFGSPFVMMSPMGFGSPFAPLSNPMSSMGMSPLSALSPMGFASPFSPLSRMGMSPMATMNPMGLTAPFGTSMPLQRMPWGQPKKRGWGFMPF